MSSLTGSPRTHAIDVLTRKYPHDFAIDFGIDASQELLDRLRDYFRTDDLDSILDTLGIEFRNGVIFTSAAIPPTHVQSKYFKNAWGVLSDRELGDVVEHPLKRARTIQEIDSYPLLDPDAVDYAAIERLIEQFHCAGDYCVYGGYWAPITYIAQQLVGMDRYMMLYYDDLELIDHLLRRITDIAIEINTRIFARIGEGMHVYFMGDDYGTQLNLMTSMDFWRVLVKPHLARIISHARSHGYLIQFHSCGSIEPIIEDFIEMGVDCLNPIQVTARNMEPDLLARRHGASISFNGGIDTQWLLSQGTPQEVREAVRKTVGTLMEHGGYILAPSQSFLPDIPTENIVAMYQEGIELQRACHS